MNAEENLCPSLCLFFNVFVPYFRPEVCERVKMEDF